jgi:hypothetical protein
MTINETLRMHLENIKGPRKDYVNKLTPFYVPNETGLWDVSGDETVFN